MRQCVFWKISGSSIYLVHHTLPMLECSTPYNFRKYDLFDTKVPFVCPIFMNLLIIMNIEPNLWDTLYWEKNFTLRMWTSWAYIMKCKNLQSSFAKIKIWEVFSYVHCALGYRYLVQVNILPPAPPPSCFGIAFLTLFVIY